ncbi:uncharacterized protein LOC117823205 [Notolabrus celidotus]|uniref:uncharacterized protein LOC117823205 n=1 Tax=Notolabrus celidotus TaxID=1203425 RepID=UPI00148F6213|nr:uncharacterized protein LOC117823205 [Notolabrus celidotus]
MKYRNRVQLMDDNINSRNKSILLKGVQWADSGMYQCKLSITTEREKGRKLGGGTVLMIYDTMIFNLTAHNDSLLCCEVKVTRYPNLFLSIFHDGSKLHSVDSAPNSTAAAQPYVTLSMNVSVRGGGKYECQLHLNAVLIMKSSFLHNPPVSGEEQDADKNVSLPCSPTVCDPGAVVFPEPWFLYGSLLLVPITILLGIIIIQKARC